MQIPCALCGYDTHGDFAIQIPGHPNVVVHTISCGPVLNADVQLMEPTHRRLDDGTYARRQTA